MKGINNMDKYDQHDHLEVLTELSVLYKLQNETLIKINIANERLVKIKKAKEVDNEIPF